MEILLEKPSRLSSYDYGEEEEIEEEERRPPRMAPEVRKLLENLSSYSLTLIISQSDSRYIFSADEENHSM